MSFNPAELEAALSRARVAQSAWGKLPVSERLKPIARLRARLADDPVALAEVVAAEIGKSRFEAIGSEILPTAEACAFLMDRAEAVLAPRREAIRGTMPFAGHAVIRHVPFGVVALIVPWNYPLFLCASSALSALVAGNAVVMKASPRARKTIEAFGQWLWDSGIPKDLAPVLDSSDEAGRALVASPLIDKIVFTGSSKTGRAVLQAAAQNLTPATLELSGFDAVYVLSDADVDLAAAAVAFGLRINSGRTCICPRRAFVEEKVAAGFSEKLKARLSGQSLMFPMDPQTLREADELATRLESTPGFKPIVSRAKGDATCPVVVSGGGETLAAAQGNFVPALVVAPVSDVEHAFKLSGASDYALGASIFTRDEKRAQEIALRAGSGLVAINECVAPGGEAALPFGGTGESGYGVRGGVEGLLDMTRPQSMAFARGKFRPHHVAGEEAEPLVKAWLRARHAGSVFGRMKGWMDYMVEGVRWRPNRK
ncbi:MAG TPA: aldehyde dehydrogenase family protein [Planctomycetota bacterium]|nr:aldehyde dehydrogenase family protein [Planctomycetota bacterium]